jgi:hypothetical protein
MRSLVSNAVGLSCFEVFPRRKEILDLSKILTDPQFRAMVISRELVAFLGRFSDLAGGLQNPIWLFEISSRSSVEIGICRHFPKRCPA